MIRLSEQAPVGGRFDEAAGTCQANARAGGRASRSSQAFPGPHLRRSPARTYRSCTACRSAGTSRPALVSRPDARSSRGERVTCVLVSPGRERFVILTHNDSSRVAGTIFYLQSWLPFLPRGFKSV
jgi:hypothetical protein